MRRTLETCLFVGGPIDGQRKAVVLDQRQVTYLEITKELIQWDKMPTDPNPMSPAPIKHMYREVWLEMHTWIMLHESIAGSDVFDVMLEKVDNKKLARFLVCNYPEKESA